MVCGREPKCKLWLRTLQLACLWNVNTINEYTCPPPGSVLVCFILLTSLFLLFDWALDFLAFLPTQDWKHFTEKFPAAKSTEKYAIDFSKCLLYFGIPLTSHCDQDCAKCPFHNLAQQIISHEHSVASLKEEHWLACSESPYWQHLAMVKPCPFTVCHRLTNKSSTLNIAK